MLRLLAILLCAAPCFAQQVDWISQIRNKPVYDVRQYAFTRKPGGSLVVGANTIIVQPCPLGVAGTDTAHYLYLSGGTGTAEAVLVTGGTCATGMSFGTVVFTAAHTHSGAWTVQSASFGLQEAVLVAGAAGGGMIAIPAGSNTLNATVTIAASGITVQGAGGMCCGVGTTINRTGDFGDSINVTGNGVKLSGFALVQTINYVTGNPGTISNQPTHGAHIELHGTNTAMLSSLRLENMPYNIWIHDGASITVRDNQFLGIWDRQASGPQVTIASVMVDSVSAIPTYIHLDNNIFYGYANTASTKHNVGPKAMVEIDACEDCYVINGSMGGGGISNLWLHPNSATTGPILANVRIQNIKFDSAQDQDLLISGDGVKSSSAILVNDNVFNGEFTSDFAVTIANAGGSATPPVENLIMNGNTVFAYLSTAFNLLDGLGIVAAGNSIRLYNATNAYATQAGSSAIYIGGRANQINLTGNQIGGGQTYANFGTGGNFCNFGITVANFAGLNTAVRLSGNFPPYYAALGNYDDLNLGSRFSGYPNRDVLLNSGAVSGSIAYNCLTDDGSANIPCEFRGTTYSFPIGVPTFASNAAAITGGLVAGTMYKTSTGQLMIVF